MWQDTSGYVERREGQQSYINPLLACDVADDVISNPEIIPFKEKIEQFKKGQGETIVLVHKQKKRCKKGDGNG